MFLCLKEHLTNWKNQINKKVWFIILINKVFFNLTRSTTLSSTETVDKHWQMQAIKLQRLTNITSISFPPIHSVFPSCSNSNSDDL